MTDTWYRSTMGVIVINLRTPWSASDNSVSAGNTPGSTNNKSGRVNDKSGSVDDKPRRICLRQLQSWQHIESLYSSLGQTTASLGTLLVHLEIIATTYHSTISKTQAFSLSSHRSIYIATKLHTVHLDRQQAVLESNSSFAWKWRSSELRDTLWGLDCASIEMHFEVVIERVTRYTWRGWSS